MNAAALKTANDVICNSVYLSKCKVIDVPCLQYSTFCDSKEIKLISYETIISTKVFTFDMLLKFHAVHLTSMTLLASLSSLHLPQMLRWWHQCPEEAAVSEVVCSYWQKQNIFAQKLVQEYKSLKPNNMFSKIFFKKT